jgi:hypothetical protein
MSKYYTIKNALVTTVIAFIVFLFSRGERIVDYMWISFVFSIMGIFISINIEEGKNILRNILFFINIFYTLMFGFGAVTL